MQAFLCCVAQDLSTPGAERRQVQALQSLQMSAIGMTSASGQGLSGGLLSSGARRNAHRVLPSAMPQHEQVMTRAALAVYSLNCIVSYGKDTDVIICSSLQGLKDRMSLLIHTPSSIDYKCGQYGATLHGSDGRAHLVGHGSTLMRRQKVICRRTDPERNPHRNLHFKPSCEPCV